MDMTTGNGSDSTNSEISFVHTADAPQPAGHYSQATVNRGASTIYVATQLPRTPGGESVLPSAPAVEQFRAALSNVRAILQAAGSDLNRTLLVTIFLADIDDWSGIDAAFAEEMGIHRPARTIIPVGGPLHLGYRVAVQAIAATG
jgi:2-iminobutanoate/2-iminopropanoate deaminase